MVLVSRYFVVWLAVFFTLGQAAQAAVVNATWNSATDVPVTASSYTATGNTVDLTLNFAPATGTSLTVVKNTGLPFISGVFGNLAQGQMVNLAYNGTTYAYVADYCGGTGNDLVLVWARNRPVSWGDNSYGNLGPGASSSSWNPYNVPMTSGLLAGRTLLRVYTGAYASYGVYSDGSVLAWGRNTSGQLGVGTSETYSTVPSYVVTAGTPLAGKSVAALSAGGNHAIALCTDGTLVAWGSDEQSQLGTNASFTSSVPVAVTTAGTALAGKAVVAVAAGSYHSLALCSDGTLASWGNGNSGQLGQGASVYGSQLAAAVATAGTALAGKTVVSISAGVTHNIALCSDGTVATWGSNSSGQLGNGTSVSSGVAVAVTTAGTVLAGKTVIAVAAGEEHSMALCSDGTVAAWGANNYGQLGNGGTTSSNVPVAVTTTGTALAGKTVVSLSIGRNTSRALCSDGTSVAWGWNSSGQLGANNYNSTSTVSVAVDTSPLGAGEKFVQMAPACAHSTHALCVVATPPPAPTTLTASSVGTTTAVINGMVNANGGNTVVSFDHGPGASFSLNQGATPATVSGSTATAVSTTLTGLTPNTTYSFRVRCANGAVPTTDAGLTFTTQDGNLSALVPGAGTLTPAFSPGVYSYRATVGAAVSSITVTPTTSLAQSTVAVNGTAVPSGSASSPVSLGYGDNTINIVVTTADGVSTVTYVLVVTRGAPSQITASFASGTGVGFTSQGFVASASTVALTLNHAPMPGTTLTVVNNTATSFIGGTFSNLAQGQVVNLTYQGATYSFVANYYGGTGNDLVLVWAGTRPVSWGYGMLGNNTTNTNSSVLVPVTTTGTPLAGRTLLALTPGRYHSLALCSDGTLAAWGWNSYGVLGDSTNTDARVPVAVTTTGTPLAGKLPVALAAGENHSLVLCSDGTLVAWGDNQYGQLGNNTNTTSNKAVAVTTGGKTVVAVRSGANHNLALCSDGSLLTWGNNGAGQLGIGTTTHGKVPVTVPTAGTPLAGRTVVAIAAGYSQCLVLCSDGTLVAWGNDTAGFLVDSNVPILVPTASSAVVGKTVVSIASGASHSLALCSDGTLVAWGENDDGTFGNGTTLDSRTPVAVPQTGVLAGRSITTLAPGIAQSLVRCADGTLAAWGDNQYGQLGNATTTDSSSPVAVGLGMLDPGEKVMQVFASPASHRHLGLVAAPAPAVASVAASAVGTTSALLNGTVNANGGTTAVTFDYGLDTTYGSTVAATPDTVTGSSSTAVSATLNGLQPNTTYHFRARGVSGAAAYSGADQTFTTLGDNLSSLALSVGTLSPAFSPTVYNYETPVAADVSSVVFTPARAAGGQATLTVNGVAVESGSASSPVPLAYGENLINITATAQNGTALTYRVKVTRAMPAQWAVAFGSAAQAPVVFSSLTATGSTVDFTLNFAPQPGTTLRVVENTGMGFINGTFSNLAQGQQVRLRYGGITYTFVASYFGGTGNDLVLQWAGTRPLAWGYNLSRQLEGTSLTNSSVPLAVPMAGTPLAGRTVVALSAGGQHSLALCSDGGMVTWGDNSWSQRGTQASTTGLTSVVTSTYTTSTPLVGKQVVAISAGLYHNLALCSDGTLASWGYNYQYQLGDNSSTISALPVSVKRTGTALAGKTVVAIRAGLYHNLVLCSDGTLAAWGSNGSGQLGTGDTNARPTAAAVTTAGTPLAGKTVVALAVGQIHSMALCSDGTLAAWGINDNGQLGNGTTFSSSLPTAVTTAGTVLAGKTIVAIAAGTKHSLALCSDGTLAAWGLNTNGQLGNNSTTQSTLPVAVSSSGVLAGKTVSGITAGSALSVAWCTDGTVATWGEGARGQLGNGTTTDSLVPVVVSINPALLAGEVFMQPGLGGSGQHCLGLVALPPPAAATLAATNVGTTTVTLNGTVAASSGAVAPTFEYGVDTAYGTTVSGTPASVTSSSPTAAGVTLSGLLPGTTYHFRVNGTNSAGTAHGEDVTFTTQDGNLASLGLSVGTLQPAFTPKVYSYQATVGAAVSSLVLTPATSNNQATVTVNGAAVASGSASSPLPLVYGENRFSLVVTMPDQVSTVSYSLVVTRAFPVAFTLGFGSAAEVPVTQNGITLAGEMLTVALNYAPVPGTSLTVLNNTGRSFISGTFGNLVHGQMVNLTYNGGTYPFVADYFGGTGNDLVLVWARTRPVSRGLNYKGQLGDNTLDDRELPGPVATVGTPLASRTILRMAAGENHSLAVCSDGSMVSWGYNYYGQLGDNSVTDRLQPVAVSTLYNPTAGRVVVSIATGAYHNLALCSDGTLVAWGYNGYGQIGRGVLEGFELRPTAVTTAGTPLAGRSVVGISAGNLHSLALCSDGTLAAWGSNLYGALGSNPAGTYVTTPTEVTTAGTPLAGKTVAAIATGLYHNIALCTDGTLATWGRNNQGQLGNGSYGDSNVPVAVTTAGTVLEGKTVIAIAAGEAHCLVLCSDGTLAAWGYNNNGQFGSTDPASSLVPVAVPTAGNALAGKTVVKISSLARRSLAQCSDGTVVEWGLSYSTVGGYYTVHAPTAVDSATLATGERLAQVAGGSLARHSLGLVASPAPTVTTLAATAVGKTTAVVNGSVNVNGGGATTVTFDYGLTTSYGMTAAATPGTVSGSSTVAVSAALTGLQPNTTYHYRVNGTGGASSISGADQTFTTANATLAGLTLSTGTLVPGFQPEVFTYSAAVGVGVTSLTLTPTLESSQDTVTVNGTPVASGSASTPVALSLEQDTVITVVVTAAGNLSTATYQVTVPQAPPTQWTAAFGAATDVAVTAGSFTAAGGVVNLSLNYAPTPGTQLTVVNNTGLAFINGRFSNLAHGQRVNLVYNGVTYAFVANYHGGTGNDLVLVWAGTRLTGWTYNSNGQLASNAYDMLSGTALAGRIPLAVAAGNAHTLAVFSDGRVGAWGNNSSGQLGTGLTTNTHIPTLVATAGTALEGKTVVAVSAGAMHSLALCSDGTLAAWGDNFYGQLGIGTSSSRTLPVAVATAGTALEGKTVVAISCGSYHSLALCSDGTLASWGSNYNSQLGNVALVSTFLPGAVTTTGTALEGKTVTAISAGAQHNVVLCSDGTLAAWGSNYNSELGGGTTQTSSTAAVPVTTAGTPLQGRTVVSVSAGGGHNLVLCSDGTLAAWGYGPTGCLGNRSYTTSSLPVAVYQDGLLQGRTVVGITCGGAHSVAWCSDGLVAAWGANYQYGQLGNNGAGNAANEPVQVLSAVGGLGERYKRVASGPNALHTLGLVATAPPDGSAPSSDASLASLTFSSGTLDIPFASDTTSYFLSVDMAAPSHLTLTPTARESYATIIVNGEVLASGATSPGFLVEPGMYTGMSVEVTAPNGSSKRTYIFYILRPTPAQQWRSHVNIWREAQGLWINSGNMADAGDFDSDGISNLMEYALNLNPKAAGTLPAASTINGGNMEYTYTRSTAAATTGTVFSVQWATSLTAPSWSTDGVTETVLSDNGTTQQVKAVIPKGAATSMFVRLSVGGPPL